MHTHEQARDCRHVGRYTRGALSVLKLRTRTRICSSYPAAGLHALTQQPEEQPSVRFRTHSWYKLHVLFFSHIRRIGFPDPCSRPASKWDWEFFRKHVKLGFYQYSRRLRAYTRQTYIYTCTYINRYATYYIHT